MRFTLHTDRRHLFFAMGTGALLLTLSAVGVYGLVLAAPSPAGPTPTESSANEESPPSSTPLSTPGALPLSRDPAIFARYVATALFTWDTRTADVSEWAQPLVDLAAPDDAPAVADDIRGYLPDTVTWVTLRGYGTRQWLHVSSIAVPSTWSEARAQAAPGQLPPGSAAYTVAGVRHRVGIVENHAVSSERAVSFTVFVACPRNALCQLLRISAVDHPLP